MMTDEQVKAEIENNKNKHDVRCNYCNSLVLKSQMSTYIEQEVQLPLMQIRKKNDKIEIEFETFRHFWHIKDMYDFENVGFTHTVENKKFLTCADCEMGPIGYKNTESQDCYVAIQRGIQRKPDTTTSFSLLLRFSLFFLPSYVFYLSFYSKNRKTTTFEKLRNFISLFFK